jgi:hypothetical protein
MESNHRKQEDAHRPCPNYPLETYEILVQGQLDSRWDQWFEGMTLSSVENGQSGLAYTLITGQVPDQPALHGLLIKIRDLNLKLISVCRVNTGKTGCEEITFNRDQ